jgi:hypothetical protein
MVVARELASDPAGRSPAPSHVLNWQDFASWRDACWRLLADVVDDAIRAEFLRTEPYMSRDDLGWLEALVEAVNGHRVDVEEYLAERLTRQYSSIRAAHGTRAE